MREGLQEVRLSDAEEIERYFLKTTGMKPGYQQLASGPVNLTVRSAALNGVSIIWTRGGGRARWRDEMSGDGLHLGFAIECDGPIRSRGRALRRNEGQLWMQDKEMDLILGGPNLTLDVGVDKGLADELGWRYDGDPIAAVSEQALSAFVQSCVSATQATAPATAPRPSEQQRDNVLEHLEPVLKPWVASDRRGNPTRRSSGHRMLTSADEFFERLQPDEKFNVDDLARSLGVSRRTIFHTFRNQYGIGPRRYFELKRLYRLRATLKSAESELTRVSDIAANLGFDDLGRTASRYQELFGEYPSETLSRRR